MTPLEQFEQEVQKALRGYKSQIKSRGIGDGTTLAAIHSAARTLVQEERKDEWTAVKDLVLNMEKSTASVSVEIVLHAQKRLAALTQHPDKEEGNG